VLDLSCSPAAPPPADADVVVVESVDLAHEQPPQQAAAIRAAAEATGTDDDVLISQVGWQLMGPALGDCSTIRTVWGLCLGTRGTGRLAEGAHKGFVSVDSCVVSWVRGTGVQPSVR
jgi:hypothetical protein